MAKDYLNYIYEINRVEVEDSEEEKLSGDYPEVFTEGCLNVLELEKNFFDSHADAVSQWLDSEIFTPADFTVELVRSLIFRYCTSNQISLSTEQDKVHKTFAIANRLWQFKYERQSMRLN